MGGFVTDLYYRSRPGRTHTLNDCPVGGDPFLIHFQHVEDLEAASAMI